MTPILLAYHKEILNISRNALDYSEHYTYTNHILPKTLSSSTINSNISLLDKTCEYAYFIKFSSHSFLITS